VECIAITDVGRKSDPKRPIASTAGFAALPNVEKSERPQQTLTHCVANGNFEPKVWDSVAPVNNGGEGLYQSAVNLRFREHLKKT
jgi:hypothetical protein